MRLIADYSTQTAHCCAQAVSAIESLPTGVNYLNTAAHFGWTPVIGQVDVNAPVKANQETGGVSVQADWSLPRFALTSITAWRFWNWWPASDLVQTPLDDVRQSAITDHQNQLSQEFRIASTGVNALDYVGGLYFFHEVVDAYGITQYGSAASYVLVSPLLPAASVTGITQTTTSNYLTNSYAAFGQATWHITPQMSLTGGLRYTYDEKSGSFVSVGAGGAALYRGILAPSAAYSVDTHKGEVAGHVDLSYQVNDDVMGYASYSRGYRSIGLNLAVLPTGASAVVAPESIDAYELGIKTKLFDHRLTLNADVFYEDDRNYQATNIIYVGPKGLTYIGNVPKVRSQGFEISAQARPMAGLSLYTSATYDDAIYASFPQSPCPVEVAIPAPASCNLSGKALSGVPRWTVSGGFEYHHSLTLGGRELEGYVGADDSYRSSEYTAATDSIYSAVPSLNLLNGRLGVRAGDHRWDAYVWGKNIGSVKYYSNITPLPYGYSIGSPGDPQTYGVTLRVHY